MRKERKYYYIYKTTNVINDKYYIGMHSTDNLNDNYIGSGKHLKYAIEKYGINNFKTEIIEWLPNRTKLKDREREIVTEELINDKKCMNLKQGGYGGLSSDEHAKKFHIAGGMTNLSLLQEGAKTHIKKLKTDPEYRKAYCKKLKGHKPWLGKKHEPETIEKMKESAIGKHVGEKNSQYGTHWITNGIKIKKLKNNEKLPEGYKFGRKSN